MFNDVAASLLIVRPPGPKPSKRMSLNGTKVVRAMARNSMNMWRILTLSLFPKLNKDTAMVPVTL